MGLHVGAIGFVTALLPIGGLNENTNAWFADAFTYKS